MFAQLQMAKGTMQKLEIARRSYPELQMHDGLTAKVLPSHVIIGAKSPSIVIVTLSSRECWV